MRKYSIFALILACLSSVCANHNKSHHVGHSASFHKLIKVKPHDRNRERSENNNEPRWGHYHHESSRANKKHRKFEDYDYSPDALSELEKVHPGDIVVVSEVTENYAYEEISCVDPHPEPISQHAEFASRLLSHRVFYPMGSTYFYNRISKLLTGKYFHQNNPTKACIRGIIENNIRRFHGFATKKISSCSGDELDATCTPADGEKHKMRVTAIWSDGESMVLLIGCTAGKGGWTVASNEQVIHHEARKIVMDKITKLGFDTTDVYELSYSQCDPAVPDKFKEGPCDENIKGIEARSALTVLHKGIFTPISSASNVYALGMFIKGELLKNEEELNDMCARHHWSPQGIVTSRGFGRKKSVLQCNIKNPMYIECSPIDKFGDNKNIYVYNKQFRPIWNDGKDYVLSYNCLSTDLKAWALYSTKKTLDKKTKDLVLSKIADYGFDPLKARLNNYEHCEGLPVDEEEDAKDDNIKPEEYKEDKQDEEVNGKSKQEEDEGNNSKQEEEGNNSKQEEDEGNNSKQEEEGNNSKQEKDEGNNSKQEEDEGNNSKQEDEGNNSKQEEEGNNSKQEEDEGNNSKQEEDGGNNSKQEEDKGNNSKQEEDGGNISKQEDDEGNNSKQEEDEGNNNQQEEDGGNNSNQEDDEEKRDFKREQEKDDNSQEDQEKESNQEQDERNDNSKQDQDERNDSKQEQDEKNDNSKQAQDENDNSQQEQDEKNENSKQKEDERNDNSKQAQDDNDNSQQEQDEKNENSKQKEDERNDNSKQAQDENDNSQQEQDEKNNSQQEQGEPEEEKEE